MNVLFLGEAEIQAPLTQWEPATWTLPGSEPPLQDCGARVPRWACRPCRIVWAVPQLCRRRECRVCYWAWACHEAAQATRRILSREFRGSPERQAILSPEAAWTPTAEEFAEARSLAYKVLAWNGWIGGCLVYHPFRARCGGCDARLGSGENCCGPKVYDVPGGHFHAIGWKQYDPANPIVPPGWVYKNIPLRRGDTTYGRLRDTLAYELDHCGLRPGRHALTWFGCLSYNQLKLDEEEPTGDSDPPACPECGQPTERAPWQTEVDGCHAVVPGTIERWERWRYADFPDSACG